LDEHQNLVRAIAVRVHEPSSLKDFNQRLKLEVAARRDKILLVSL
jgi:hypothetical protein